MIVVPPAVGEQVRGALMLGRLAPARDSRTDLDMAASFAGHAAVAMELAQARIDQGTLAQAEDRDRIAGDLLNHVIRTVRPRPDTPKQAARSDPATAERINGYVDTLNEVITKIRTSIFGLHQPRHASAGLPARLLEIIEEIPAARLTADIGFARPAGPRPGRGTGPRHPFARHAAAGVQSSLSSWKGSPSPRPLRA